MTAAKRTGAIASEKPAIRHPDTGVKNAGLVQKLEARATMVLVLAVVLAAVLLWDGYANIFGWLFAHPYKTLIALSLGLAMGIGGTVFVGLDSKKLRPAKPKTSTPPSSLILDSNLRTLL